MVNMKLLEVVTPPYIYHGCYTWKTFLEEKFTGEEHLTLGEFTSVKMKNCGCWNVRKNIEINDSDKYITLEISLKFGSMENTRITWSYPKGNLGKPGKGLITSLGIKNKASPEK